MSFDLGALVTRMVVQGRAEFERDINAGGDALKRAAGKGDEFDKSLAAASARSVSFGQQVRVAGSELVNMGDRGRIALQQVGTGLTIAGLAVAALVGVAVAKYAEYDAAISRSVTATGAYGEELERVRNLTQELGASTVFTATEAAQGVTELGKAGVETAEILGGALAGSLNLAAAGELAVADAAAITASTLNQFNLRGDKAVHISDLLAAGAGKAQGSVTDMGAALNQAGLVANQMGISVEDATGTLAAFASAGLIGSDAGTSFRTMLLSLATPTAQQLALQKQYNIEAYDAQGNFIGLTALAEKLKTGLGGLTSQQRDYTLGVVFGSDAIRAANVLYNEGAKGIQEWNANVNEGGYAARAAATNVDNLSGDLEKLGGAFDAALIKTGAGADGVLRDLVQTVTDLVSGFAELPDWMQQVVLVGALLTAGTLLFAGATLVGISRVIELRANLALMRAEMPMTTAALGRVSSFLAGPWGIAIAAAALGLSALDQYLTGLQASSEEMQASLTSATSAADIFATATKGIDDTNLSDVRGQFKDLNAILNAAAEQDRNLFARFDSTYFGAFNALKKLGTELGTLAKNDLPSAQRAFSLMAAETDGSRQKLWELLSNMPDYRDQLIVIATAQGTYNETMSDAEKKTALLDAATGANIITTKTAAAAYIEAADEADALEEELDQLLDTLNKANKSQQDAIGANADYQAALEQVDEAIENARNGVEGYSLGLDENTAAGAANVASLADLAAAGQEAADAQYGLTNDTNEYINALQNTHQAVYDRAIALGATATEAQNLADKIAGIPTDTQIQILVESAAAERKLNAITTAMNAIRAAAKTPGTITISGGIGDQISNARGNIVKYYASGGMENHAPQIAAAGAMRVWAEPETGGEAYIPFAMDRRARSEGILATVARMFGGTYIPAGARAMAGGGSTAGGGAGDGEMRIRGTLDLGNGLTGLVDGVISQRLDEENDTRGNELR